jgi:uncharacterized Zn-binding protein involved in type VI secretion
MTFGIARLGDRTIGQCSCHTSTITVGGTIITASPNTIVNGMNVARLGDTVLADCGHTGTIVTSSPTNICNGAGIARLGDRTTGCYVATIITASPNDLTT